MALTGEAPVATVAIDGERLADVTWVRGRSALNALFYFRILALHPVHEARSVAELLGKPCELRLRARVGEPLVVKGVVDEVSCALGVEWATYELRLVPEVATLALGLDSYAYREKSAVDIVRDVLESADVAGDKVEWRLSGTYEPRAYVAQYAESDWAFVERVLADEGLWYAFEFGDEDTRLVIADSSPDAPEVAGGSSFLFRPGSGLLRDAEGVTELRSEAQLAHTSVRLADYDSSRPSLGLDVRAGEERGRDVYDYPGHFSTPDAGRRRAQRRLEGLGAERHVVTGEGAGTRIRSGLRFTVLEHPVSALNAEYLCLEVHYEATQRGKDGAPGLRTRWRAIPAQTPFRRGGEAFEREVPGPQTGMVCGPPGQELHTSDVGQVRVQFRWDREGQRDDKASTWMRIGQVPFGGSMVAPRIGWDVLAGHGAGLADAPLVLAHLYDGEHATPYALPQHKTRTAWQTATTPGGGSANEIRFEDAAGAEEMFLNASHDMAVSVHNDKTKTVGVNHSHKVGVDRSLRVGTNASLGVTGEQSLSVGAAEMLSVSGARSVTLGGNDTHSVGAARTVTATQGHSLDVGGGRSLTVGASMLCAAGLGVDRAVLGTCSVTVGGAWLSVAGAGLDNATAGASAETVGGAKVQAGAGGIALSVKGVLAETVGGAYVNSCGGNAGETAKGALKVNVGGVFIANAPKVLIEAESRIVIRCGGASITITGSSVEVKAPSLASPGATIVKDGSTVKHNP